jgi:DNA end-binding protein Ku
MAPRANWKGYLKLSLVSCAVALYPASRTTGRISFHTLSRKTGNRLRRQMFDPDTGDVVETEDQAKGYEVAKGQYVVVDDEELDAIALESTHTIDIESFVPRAEIDEVYYDSPYYLAPDDKVAQEAFAVIREAMQRHDVVGLARVVLYRRERIVMIEPRGKGLFVATLRYPYEVREDDAYFEEIPDVKIQPDMLDLATHIIDRMAGHFDPTKFEDRYEEALVALVKSKQNGEPLALPEAPRPANVVNLMDALRRSLDAERGGGSAPPAGKPSAAKKAAGKAASSTPAPSASDAAKRSSPKAKAAPRPPAAEASKPAPEAKPKSKPPASRAAPTSGRKPAGMKKAS